MSCAKAGAVFLLVKSMIHILLIAFLGLNMACRDSKTHWRRANFSGCVVQYILYVILTLIQFIWAVITFLAVYEDRDDLNLLALSSIMIAWFVIFLAWETAYLLSWAINLRDINWAMLVYIILLILIAIYGGVNVYLINCVAQFLFKKFA